MRNSVIIGLMILNMCLVLEAYSQGNFAVHIGAAFPVSDFAGHDFHNKAHGGATAGLNFGFLYTRPVRESAFGLFAGMDITHNSLQKRYEDNMEFILYDTLSYNITKARYHKYFNIPVNAGFSYTFIKNKMGFFVNAGPALNFLKITDMLMDFNGETWTQQMSPGISLGYKIGGGILINENLSVSVNYLALGKPTVKRYFIMGGFYSSHPNGKASWEINLLTVTVGFRFKEMEKPRKQQKPEYA